MLFAIRCHSASYYRKKQVVAVFMWFIRTVHKLINNTLVTKPYTCCENMRLSFVNYVYFS